MFRSILSAAAVASLLFVGPAVAQIIPLEDDYYTELPDGSDVAVTTEPSVAEPQYVEPQFVPPVYGWTHARPADCGVFRYWSYDEGRCVDARFDPPHLGGR